MLGDSDTALEHSGKLVDQYTDDRKLEGEAEMKMARILVYQQQSATAVARLSAYIERQFANTWKAYRWLQRCGNIQG